MIVAVQASPRARFHRQPWQKNLLLIPESRKRPITGSLLYKQIVRFFEEEKIRDKFEIKFIEVPKGKLPPKRFSSGRSWISREVIEEMADSIAEYLGKNGNKYNTKIAYVRGSYLEAVRLAVKKTGIEIKEIFSDDELSQLKKKGIMWMKVGLRMPTAFIVFKMKIKYMIMDMKEAVGPEGLKARREQQLRLF